MRVLIIGNSQTGAIGRAYNKMVESDEGPKELTMEFRFVGVGRELQEKFFSFSGDQVTTFSDKAPTSSFGVGKIDFDAVGVVAPYYSSLLCRDPDWEKFGLSHNSDGKMAISRYLVEHATRYSQRFIIEFIKELKAKGTNVFVVEAARLFRGYPQMRRNGLKLVSEIDQIFRNVMSAELEKLSVKSVMIPSENYDDMGFLLPRHRIAKENDFVHANTAFGGIMIDEIVSFLRQSEKA